MTILASIRRALPPAVPGSTRDRDPSPAASPPAVRRTSRRRALRIGGLAAVALVLAGGSLAVAGAHKTVTLDVDGRTTEVTTFAGSVAGLLDEQGVDAAGRDLVAPGAGSALRSGDEVVVRHAHALVVESDGAESTVWTTALNADEALATLARRGDDVRLIPSRSAGSVRPNLSLVLGAGPVDVLVDGRTERVDASGELDETLAGLGISLGELDRVYVARSEGRLTVVVQRVVVREEVTTSAVPFETLTERSADLYQGQRRTVVAGVDGERTTLSRTVLVDGVEEARRVIGDSVTTAPVAAVVREGTASRPVPSAGAVVTGDVWGALALCESGGNPAAVSRNGLYYGLYQFSLSTWQAMGGSGLPSDASAEEQLQRAQALQARSGWGQWPACAASLGLL